MKTFFLFFMLCFSFQAHALESDAASKAYDVDVDPHPYQQLLSLEMGPFHPASISISNSDSSFSYPNQSLNSFVVEPGWSIKLFKFAGAFYLEEGLPISMLKGSVAQSSDTLSLFMLGLDTRLKYSMEWFPLRAVIPFVDVGYQFTGYDQSGASDNESVQGTVGNAVAGAGLDIWLNPGATQTGDHINDYATLPILLTAKFNWIGQSHSEVNLGGTSFLAGISIGI